MRAACRLSMPTLSIYLAMAKTKQRVSSPGPRGHSTLRSVVLAPNAVAPPRQSLVANLHALRHVYTCYLVLSTARSVPSCLPHMALCCLCISTTEVSDKIRTPYLDRPSSVSLSLSVPRNWPHFFIFPVAETTAPCGIHIHTGISSLLPSPHSFSVSLPSKDISSLR